MTLLALAAPHAAHAATAAPKQAGPFALRIADSRDAALNGRFLSSCHAGAGIEVLCYAAAGSPGGTAADAAQYYFNTTADGTGVLYWNLPIGGAGGQAELVPSAVRLEPRPDSDLAPAMLYPGAERATALAFDRRGRVFVTAPYDEATFAAGDRPRPKQVRLYRWQACWNFAGGYYYPTINWAAGAGRPRNPTCVAVNITKV